MKKVLLISGLLTILLFSITLSGEADTDYMVKKAVWQGNSHYKKARYEAASSIYETCLIENADNKALRYNAAQSAYMQGQYDKSIKYYEDSDDSIEKYLNAGNAHFMIADASTTKYDAVISLQQAQQVYQDGIERYPQNIPLKYNYEIAANRMMDLLTELEQENGDEQQEPDSSPEDESEPEEDDKERMMQTLESIEEEALKENQMIIGGEDEENGW